MQGANFDVRSSEGDTAIGRTIEQDSILNETIDNLRALLASGADPDGITRSGDTPLLHAMQFGKIAHFEELLKYGANPTKRSQDVFPSSAIEVAMRSRDSLYLELIKKYSER